MPKSKQETEQILAAAADIEAAEPPVQPAIGLEPESEVDLMDDEPTREAIASIARKESSTMLDIQDARANGLPDQPQKKQSFLKRWWGHKRLRNGSLFAGLLILAILAAVPASRYTILNTAGVRVSARVTVLDEATGRPINNVVVMVDGKESQTNQEGIAEFSDMKLGPAEMSIQKRSFASLRQQVTLGLGSNPFTPFRLTPTGFAYGFTLTDWLSGLPIEGAEVSEADSEALSDKDGKAQLKVDPENTRELSIVITAPNYRTQTVVVPADTEAPLLVKLVADQPHFFITQRDGTLDVYKIDGDGTNEELLLKGNGNERDDIQMLSSPDASWVAVVSTRRGIIDTNGYAKESLYVISTTDKQASEVVTDDGISLVSWSGTRIIYTKTSASESGNSSSRYKLLSYDAASKSGLQLASAWYFSDILVTQDDVYFSPLDSYSRNQQGLGLYRVQADGTDKRTVHNEEVWGIQRTGYTSLLVSLRSNTWLSYDMGDPVAKPADTPAATPKDRRYVDSPDGSFSVWHDTRDGKGVLVLWDVKAQTEKVIYSDGGVSSPLTWLSNKHVVWRKSVSGENASYVVSIDGGPAQKITDIASVRYYDY